MNLLRALATVSGMTLLSRILGATGVTGARAYYSNYGARVDLSAPGGGGAVAYLLMWMFVPAGSKSLARV